MLEPAFRYRATPLRVKDGDTFIARAELGFYVSTAVTIRLRGINAPELRTTAGREAKVHLETILASNELVIASFKDERSFERWVCDAWLGDGRNLAQVLIEDGYGVAA